MKTARSQAELVTLRKHAQEIAAGRKERMTSVHLLAAVASTEGPAGDLLRSCRLDPEALLKASRSFDDEGPDPVGRLFAAARELCARSPAPRGPSAEPTALHLLLALLADRSAAAHRSLVHAGVDLARLRTRAIPLSQGLIAARRPSTLRAKVEGPPARALPSRPMSPQPTRPSGPATSMSPGVAVPLFPPPQGRRDTQRPGAPSAAPAAAPSTASTVALSPTPAPAPAEPARKSHARGPAPSSPPASGPRVPVEAMERFTLDRELFPVLTTLGHNLTLAAAQGKLEEVVGREADIEEVLDILAKRHANSPCLVGPAGVGKTSVVHGLAQRFARASELGETRIIVEIVLSELLAGTGTRGALAEKIAAIRAEVKETHGLVLLFVDEAHELFGPGSLDEATAEIKLGLARGEMTLITATTPEEYRKSIESDTALARRFSVVEIEEPCEEDAFLLLQSVAAGLGRHHGLRYDDEALAASVAWSIRYLPGRALPDKAISILDLAGARARRKLGSSGPRDAPLGASEVAEVVSELADLPVERLLETDRERMLSLESLLAERVVGHTKPLERIARVLRRNAAGLRGRRPIGSFLLLGPTGVGKTETAKAIAEALFHSADAMTRLDFSEYAEAHAVARLVGAPPGYIGHEAGGQLTEAVRRRPYQVILLDEIEKAHRDVLEAFLQVFDEGRLTDGRGRRVDFTNTVIVMTSNLGAAEAGAVKAERSVGFSRSTTGISSERLAEVMLSAAKSFLPPELYNRIDEVLCFAPLARADVAEVARRLLGGLSLSLLARGVRLDVDPLAIEALLEAGGFDAELGARPMKRAIARLIENPLAELILRGELDEGSVALVSVERGEIVVDALDGERAAAAS